MRSVDGGASSSAVSGGPHSPPPRRRGASDIVILASQSPVSVRLVRAILASANQCLQLPVVAPAPIEKQDTTVDSTLALAALVSCGRATVELVGACAFDLRCGQPRLREGESGGGVMLAGAPAAPHLGDRCAPGRG
jgi:hypothetical protein